MIKTPPITVIVPTYNAGDSFKDFCRALKTQKANIQRVLIIDSSSTDATAAVARGAGFQVTVIPKSEFGHGKTRQMALEMTETENAVYMTQDALLADENAVARLVQHLNSDDLLGAVYGRQLPCPHTGPLGAFARLFNYPDRSFINTLADRQKKGIKAAFLSDTFAAYKKSLLMEIGGFPVYSRFGEDSYVAGKLLLAGYKTGYCAEARVYHAHDYTLRQEFRRSQGIKLFHKQEPWLLQEFGKPEGEGLRLVICQLKWLLANGNWHIIPLAFMHNMVKFIGYKL